MLLAVINESINQEKYLKSLKWRIAETLTSVEESSSQNFLAAQMYNLVRIVFVNTKLMALRLGSLFNQIRGRFFF